MSSPPAQTQSPPQNRKSPYWKLSGDGSDMDTPYLQAQQTQKSSKKLKLTREKAT